jgi:hypothetical protein
MAPKKPGGTSSPATPKTQVGSPGSETPSSSAKRKRAGKESDTGSGGGANTGSRVCVKRPFENMQRADILQKTPRRKSEKPKEIFHPGDDNDPKSFVDISTVEARVAAYVGFTDTRQLKWFLISHHFQDFFKYYSKDDFAKAMHRRGPFDLIRDRYLRHENDKVESSDGDFPNDKLDRLKKYSRVDTNGPKAEKSRKEHHLAHILIMMVKLLSQFKQAKIEPEEQEKCSGQLKKQIEDAKKVPELYGSVEFPQFVFEEFNEGQLEP